MEKISSIFVLTIILSGCSSVPPASSDFERKAQSYTQPPNLASLYVYRSNSFLGASVLYNISLDHNDFGTLGTGTYLFANIVPGKHSIRANTSGVSQVKITKFNAMAGKLYFFKIEPAWNSLNIEIIEDSKGREQIGKYTLSGDNAFEQ